MNSVTIGTYNMQTSFGLYLPEYTIPAPTPQTKFVTVIGHDGEVDLSNALGDIHFNSRKWSLDFKSFDPTVNWHTLSSNVMNAIHGKRLNFSFADDPNYYWTGRVSVTGYWSKMGEGTLRVEIVSDPYKTKTTSTTVSKALSLSMTSIALTNNGSKTVVPTVTSSVDAYLRWGSYTYNMQAGTAIIPELVLPSGTTTVEAMTGEASGGTIAFTYTEGSL